MSGKSKFRISRTLDERIKRIVKGSSISESEFSQTDSAYILGFNYGNVTNCLALTANYQLHHAVFPVVGLVFKGTPSEDDIKTNIRSVREYSSSPNGLGSFKSDKNEHLFLVYNAELGSDEVEKRIFDFSQGSFARRKRLRLEIVNDLFYPHSADLLKLDDVDSVEGADDEPIDHLIFFIHGVGGVCDVRFRSCVEVVADFKKMANDLLANQSETVSRASTPSNKHIAKHLKKGFFRRYSTESSVESDLTTASESTSASRAQRVECLPISWHSSTRRQTGLNDHLSTVSLDSAPRLRHFLNKVVMDALVYACGPVYTQTVVNNVGNEINRLYTLFMEKHPDFCGSVSLAGHSLGSVIVFDLLANQNPSGNFSPVPSEDAQTNNIHINNNNNETINSDSGNDDTSNNNNNDSTIQEEGNKGDNGKNKISNSSCGIASHDHHLLRDVEPGDCMNYKNIDELLRDLDLTQHTELFQREHIDLKTILLLTDLDMKELNLPVVTRRKLVNYINYKKFSEVVTGMQRQYQEPNSNLIERILVDNMKTGQYLIRYPQLKFKPRCFFAFGSPMPLFQTCRGMPEMSKNFKLPTCDRVFNIFHPYDPLAYRIEPLIDPRYKDVEPIQIPHHRGGKRMHVQLREGISRVSHNIKHGLLGSIKGTWASITNMRVPQVTEAGTSSEVIATNKCNKKKALSSDVDMDIDSPHASDCETSCHVRKQLKRQVSVGSPPDSMNTSEDKSEPKMSRQNSQFSHEKDTNSLLKDMSLSEKSKPKSVQETIINVERVHSESLKNSEPDADLPTETQPIGRLNEGNRIDYVLQEKTIELFNEYLFAFTSHASYWQNEDSALMVLKEIYKVDGVNLE